MTKKRRGPVPKPGGSKWVFPAALVAIVLVGVLAVVLVASGGSNNQKAKVGGKTATVETASKVTVDGTSLPRYTATTPDAAIGLAAPTLKSVDFADDTVTAGGATGKPYALVFLAHWCPHCQAEVPRLVSVGKAGQIAGVDVTGIPTGTSKTYPNYPPSAWLARENWPYSVLLDSSSGTAAQAYGLASYPYLVFVDSSGKVAGRFSGEIAPADLTAAFSALAAGKPVPLPGAGASSAG